MIKKGFSLIELLVVISIIGILLGLSVFGLQGARQASRDARRKSDLEMIRSGLEIFKADCDRYPTTLGTTLVGSTPPPSCLASNTYIATVPKDPTDPASTYAYTSNGTTYTLCTTLEQAPSPTMPPNPPCGSCTTACNYRVVNP